MSQIRSLAFCSLTIENPVTCLQHICWLRYCQAVIGNDAVNCTQPQLHAAMPSLWTNFSACACGQNESQHPLSVPQQFLEGICFSESLLLRSGIVGELRKRLGSDALIRVYFLTCQGLY